MCDENGLLGFRKWPFTLKKSLQLVFVISILTACLLLIPQVDLKIFGGSFYCSFGGPRVC